MVSYLATAKKCVLNHLYLVSANVVDDPCKKNSTCQKNWVLPTLLTEKLPLNFAKQAHPVVGSAAEKFFFNSRRKDLRRNLNQIVCRFASFR